MSEVLLPLRDYHRFVYKDLRTVNVARRLPMHFSELTIHWKRQQVGFFEHLGNNYFMIKITRARGLTDALLQGSFVVLEQKTSLVGGDYLELSSGSDLVDRARITMWRKNG